MEHLEKWTKELAPQTPTWRVRLAGQVSYDRQPFLQYPDRLHRDLTQTLRNATQNQPESDPDLAAFLEDWLIFGLLCEYFGQDLDLRLFVAHDMEQDISTAYLSTAALLPLLQAHKSTSNKWASGQRDSWVANTRTCLATARMVTQILSAAATPIDVQNLILVVMVLGSTLEYFIGWISNTAQSSADSFHVLHGGVVVSWGTSRLVVHRLLDAGWCPADIARAHSNLATVGMYIAGCISPYRVTQHHAACTRAACSSESLEPDQYRALYPSHQGRDCYRPDMSAILAILASGRVPLLRMHMNESSKSMVHFDVNCIEPGVQFTAISHVWSHGLGNPDANSLPREMLLQLFDFLQEPPTSIASSQASGEVQRHTHLFWLDTFCVPLAPGPRKLAIQRINLVFRTATRVLVLDKSLTRLSQHLSPAALTLAVAYSPWMRRLWTFAEGTLSRKLEFQFRDGTCALADLMPALVAPIEDAIGLNFHLSAARPLLVFRLVHATQRLGEKLSKIWNDVTYRSTTRASDEALVLGMLLDLSPQQMADLSLVETTRGIAPMSQMEALLPHLDEFPARVIFAAGPRVQTPGSGWAIESLLNRGDLAGYDAAEDGRTMPLKVGVRSEVGLQVTYPGFLLDMKASDLPQTFTLKHPATGTSYVVLSDTTTFRVTRPATYLFSDANGASASTSTSANNPHSSAIILPCAPSSISSGKYAVLLSDVRSTQTDVPAGTWHRRLWLAERSRADDALVVDADGVPAVFSQSNAPGRTAVNRGAARWDGLQRVSVVAVRDGTCEWCVG